jgi:hypothetical protein
MSGGNEGTSENERNGSEEQRHEDKGKWQWIRASLARPDNLPHFLTALFTLILAIFAIFAWREAREGTVALRGQLEAMREEQRPRIWTQPNLLGPPAFNEQTSRVQWNWPNSNQGKSPAYAVRTVAYIKVGDGKFELSQASPGGESRIPYVAPNDSSFLTALSRTGFSKDYILAVGKTDFAFGLLVEIEYTDSTHSRKWSDVFCVVTLASGAIMRADPVECQNMK